MSGSASGSISSAPIVSIGSASPVSCPTPCVSVPRVVSITPYIDSSAGFTRLVNASLASLPISSRIASASSNIDSVCISAVSSIHPVSLSTISLAAITSSALSSSPSVTCCTASSIASTMLSPRSSIAVFNTSRNNLFF